MGDTECKMGVGNAAVAGGCRGRERRNIGWKITVRRDNRGEEGTCIRRTVGKKSADRKGFQGSEGREGGGLGSRFGVSRLRGHWRDRFTGTGKASGRADVV